MANFTSADLLAIIELAEPVFPKLVFYKFEQLAKQRIYPSVEIDEVQPQSPEETTQLRDFRTRFELRIFIRYADRATDTDNLETLERNILNTILAATLTTGKLVLESETFQRGPIADNPLNVNGIQSALTLYFEEREAKVGIIGLQQTLDIGSITGLQIIGETGSRGRNSTTRSNDDGYTKVNKGTSVGTKFWEYMYTKANFDIIESLIDADNEITVTLKEGPQGNTVLVIKPLMQRESVRFDGQKTVILEVDIVTV